MAIAFLAEKMPLKWILNHQQVIIMALMYVLLDLSNEVSRTANAFKHILHAHGCQPKNIVPTHLFIVLIFHKLAVCQKLTISFSQSWL